MTAVGTIALAMATFHVIQQGRQLRQDNERKHRDQFKPICLLAPYSGIDPWNRRRELLETRPPASEDPSFGTVAIWCILRNVGAVAALKLRLKLRFPDMNGWTSEPWELSPLGAGEICGSEVAPLLVPFRIHEGFNEADFATLTGKLREIWLEYEDVFGNPFVSVHRKVSVDTDLATATWTTAGPNRQPRASLRLVPWFTYSEGPTP